MPRKSYAPDQIIGKLREAELLIHKGHTAEKAIREIGVSEYTYYRWRRGRWYGDGAGEKEDFVLGEKPGPHSKVGQGEEPWLPRPGLVPFKLMGEGEEG